jgi:hypothetical protein
MLWGMPEVAPWVLDEKNQPVLSGDLGDAYANLVGQMKIDPLDEEAQLDSFIEAMREIYAKKLGKDRGNFIDFIEYLRDKVKPTSKNTSEQFEVFLRSLFDSKKSNRPGKEKFPPFGVIAICSLEYWQSGQDCFTWFGHFPSYLLYYLGEGVIANEKLPEYAASVPLELDLRPVIIECVKRENEFTRKQKWESQLALEASLLPAFELDQDSQYELVFMEIRPSGAGHVAAYVKSPDDGKWYYADSAGKQWGQVARPGDGIGGQKKVLWSPLFYPTKLLYRKKDGQLKPTPLQAFSASLETLAGQCKLLTSV